MSKSWEQNVKRVEVIGSISQALQSSNFSVSRMHPVTQRDLEQNCNWRRIARVRTIRPKIESAIRNARAFIKIRDEFGTFDAYIWRFVNGKPVRNNWKSISDIPASTNESNAMSKDLKKRGFSFVGGTTCYAFMQAGGMANDHTVVCFRWRDLDGVIQ